jgi:hypothetical protein
MATAKHCLDGTDHPNNDNSYIAQAMPVTITTADDKNGRNDRFASPRN